MRTGKGVDYIERRRRDRQTIGGPPPKLSSRTWHGAYSERASARAAPAIAPLPSPLRLDSLTMALIRFSSKAAGELFMFEQDARHLLGILGKEQTPKGIITADQVAGAIATLKAAIDTQTQEAGADAKPALEPADPDLADTQAQRVSLRQRAFPLIDMLERAQAKQTDVLWGV